MEFHFLIVILFSACFAFASNPSSSNTVTTTDIDTINKTNEDSAVISDEPASKVDALRKKFEKLGTEGEEKKVKIDPSPALQQSARKLFPPQKRSTFVDKFGDLLENETTPNPQPIPLRSSVNDNDNATDLMQKISSLVVSIELLKDEIQEKDMEIEVLKGELLSNLETIQNLELELKNSADQIETLTESNRRKLSEKNKQVGDLQIEISKLKNKLKALPKGQESVEVDSDSSAMLFYLI